MAKTAEPKTKVSNASVTDFINSIDNEQKRKDSFEILNIMKHLTKEEPKMWGRVLSGSDPITTSMRVAAKEPLR